MVDKMKTFIIIVNILMYVVYVTAVFDIDELKSFNYGIDIRNEPVVMSSEEDEQLDLNTVKLTSKYGQPYQCSFPNTVEHEKQKEEAEKVALETGIPDLLRPMETSPCLRKTKDWWSYEFCYGKQIKQFHLSDDGRIEGELILLGYFESEYNWDEDAGKTEEERKQSQVRRYHTQQYVNGTSCELNNKLRKTEVRFVCEEGSADYIARLDEPETCVYIMTIHTMKICHHPFLKSPTPTKTVTITCNPLLTVVQYQEYLDELEAREEKQRLEAEKREKLEAEKKQKEEELRKIKDEKAKYFQENQLKPDIRIFVHHNDEVTSLEVNPAETVLSLKFKLAQRKNYPVNQQVLMYEGRFLKDGKTLADYNIVKTASISMALSTNHDIIEDEEEEETVDNEDNDDNNDDDDDDDEGLVEEESDGLEETGGQETKLSNDWSEILKNAQGGDPSVTTVFKVVESSEDLKNFIKESVEAMKKMKQANLKTLTDENNEDSEESEEETEDDTGVTMETQLDENLKYIQKLLSGDKGGLNVDSNDDTDDELDDPDLEELNTEIKTLKERYKNRRDRLTDIKKKVRASMNEQYNEIIKEAKSELGEAGMESPEEQKQVTDSIKQFTKTIDNLLDKLDKTEKEIESVDKELEQFAEYDGSEKVKSIPPVKGSDSQPSATGPLKIVDNNRVKVKVSRLKRGDRNSLATRNQQTAELEKSVQKELEKAGLGDGEKIQVKIITTGYIDGDDDAMHVLSQQESETFRNMIVDMIGGQSEVEKEQKKQEQQEENYSFVWGRNKHTVSDNTVTDTANTNTDTHTETSDTESVLETDTEES